MTYAKQTWVDSDATKPLSAARLGVIENGLEAIASFAVGANGTSILNVPATAHQSEGAGTAGLILGATPGTGLFQTPDVWGTASIGFVFNGWKHLLLEHDGTGATLTFHGRTTNRMQFQSDSAIVFIAGTGHIEYETGHATNPIEVIGYKSATADGRTIVFRTDPTSAQAVPLAAQACAGMTVDIFDIYDSGALTVLSRFNKAGYFMTRKSTAPADADLVAGELAIYGDFTNGAPAVKFKGKTLDGTVFTKSL